MKLTRFNKIKYTPIVIEQSALDRLITLVRYLKESDSRGINVEVYDDFPSNLQAKLVETSLLPTITYPVKQKFVLGDFTFTATSETISKLENYTLVFKDGLFTYAPI